MASRRSGPRRWAISPSARKSSPEVAKPGRRRIVRTNRASGPCGWLRVRTIPTMTVHPADCLATPAKRLELAHDLEAQVRFLDLLIGGLKDVRRCRWFSRASSRGVLETAAASGRREHCRNGNRVVRLLPLRLDGGSGFPAPVLS